MDSRVHQQFEQEVNTVVGKSKQKRSEDQLKALAEGRRKRWLEKSQTSDVSATAEESPSKGESELNGEEKKSDPSISESEPALKVEVILMVIMIQG